ncbi:MAG: MBOAT family protein [Muribaculaceae bacterium]|nr:MBOAT family protein [Muribaculaceae bacterium]
MQHVLDLLFGYHEGEPMLFSSGTFWALFLLFLPLYALLSTRRNRTMMLAFVLLFSLFFYYKSSGLFVGLLAATSVVDWGLSQVIARSSSRAMRRACVGVSLVFSLGILGYFKYANFFMMNLSAIVGSNFQPLELVLPVGISFYTFQSVSYIIDVYKGTIAPTRRWLDYAFFLSFFPALVAGPIVRAKDFLGQIAEHRPASRHDLYYGFWLVLVGVVKKAIVADYIAQYNDLIFQSPTGYNAFETLMGIIGYTMQIYCDFSGYSDMAIGLALVMGFRLNENFNFPYKSQNLTDFWRRWHISLSTWLRDYVYIPLGGNRKGTARTYVNNMATMLVGGLWHGAAWKFVFWGGMHGAGLAVHKAAKPHLGAWSDVWPVRALSWLVTMVFVACLWVFFRADSWGDSWLVLRQVFVGEWPGMAGVSAFASARMLWLALMVLIISAHALPSDWRMRAGEAFVRSRLWVKFLIFVIIVQAVLQLQGEDVAPFIYFQF